MTNVQRREIIVHMSAFELHMDSMSDMLKLPGTRTAAPIRQGHAGQERQERREGRPNLYHSEEQFQPEEYIGIFTTSMSGAGTSTLADDMYFCPTAYLHRHSNGSGFTVIQQ